MINYSEYIDNITSAPKLFEKLKEKVFLKTEFDVVYSDIANWERAGLLFYKDENDDKKGNWKKISYTEYVWIKIVELLKEFGCDNNVIIQIKENLTEEIKVKDIIEAANRGKDLIEEAGVSDELSKLNNVITEEMLEMSVGFSDIDLIIINIIIKAEQMSLFFNKNNPENFMFFSNEILFGFEDNRLDLFKEFFCDSFFSIPISSIISKFIINDDKTLNFEDQLTMIITPQEHKLLKIIRKKFNDIKSLKIKFKEGNIELIEITSIKKVALESKLIDHIKKGDYQKIIIDTVDGKIVNFENTQKIKYDTE